MIQVDGISTILLDIEGTICPISFVKDVLYPYALSQLPSVLARDWSDPIFASYKASFPAAARASPEALTAHVTALSAADSKDAALKKLQGYVWRIGYGDGTLATPLFADVVPALRRWRKGRRLAVFSSGSVEAQRMFFSRVEARDEAGGAVNGDGKGKAQLEDLAGLFVANYDTVSAGPKMLASSYVRICVEMKVDADTVLFLSDNVKEIRAALDAGMKAIVVDRPGNAPLSEEDRAQLKVISSLDEINFTESKEPQLGKEEKPEEKTEAVVETEKRTEPETKDKVEEKPVKTTPKRKRQSKEGEPDPKSLRRSKRLSGE